MKWQSMILGGCLALAAPLYAEDKVSAEITGTAEVVGISPSGELVGDQVSSYEKHPVHGKVSVVTKRGRVHRVETYTEWSGSNGVRARVWEKLWVAGGTFTGWTERLIQTSTNVVFSRNVIDGDFEQKIETDGSGYAEWTVTGSDTAIESDDSNAGSDSDGDLPAVEIMEEDEFDGVSDRRIDIKAKGDRAEITFRDKGYTRATVETVVEDDENDINGDNDFTQDDGEEETTETQVTINQELKMEGRGKGSLAFIPKVEVTATTAPATPFPSPTPMPGVPTDEGGFDGTIPDQSDGTDFSTDDTVDDTDTSFF